MARSPPIYDDEIEDEVQRLDPNDGGPATTALHGEDRTRRPFKTEAERSQGPKTRAANKERVKGSRPFNPR